MSKRKLIKSLTLHNNSTQALISIYAFTTKDCSIRVISMKVYVSRDCLIRVYQSSVKMFILHPSSKGRCLDIESRDMGGVTVHTSVINVISNCVDYSLISV